VKFKFYIDSISLSHPSFKPCCIIIPILKTIRLVTIRTL